MVCFNIISILKLIINKDNSSNIFMSISYIKSICGINNVIKENGKIIIDIKGTKIILFNIVIKLMLKKLFINIGILTENDINEVIRILIK